MEEILEPFRDWISGMLDDVCVRAESKEQLHKRLLLLFDRFAEYSMVLNTQKSRLFVPEGVFLGFIVNKDGIRVDPAKVSAIRDRPIPQTTTEIRGFVNGAGYFRPLIEGYSEKSGLLTDYCTGPKNSAITLSPEAESQWRNIRDIITSLPLVVPFDWRLPCVIDVDTSARYTGAALLQPHPRDLHHINVRLTQPSLVTQPNNTVLRPVAYFSKKLNDTQARYSSQERELLGILLAVQHWKHWVTGAEITIITDHESLKTIKTKTDQPPRMMRFIDALEHYGVKIIWRPGKDHVLADYLSRPPTDIGVEPVTIFPNRRRERSDRDSLKALPT